MSTTMESTVSDEPENAGPFCRVAHARIARTLSKLQPGRTLLAILGDWAIVAGVAWTAWSWAPVWLWPLAWLLIATRQHALLILLHDAAHGSLVRQRRWNDAIADVFCGWPMFVSTAAYRESHLRHHRFVNTDRDPDLVRKLDEPHGAERWLRARPRRTILFGLIALVCGGGLLAMVAKMRRFHRQGAKAGTRAGVAWRRVTYYAVVATILTSLSAWPLVLCFWFVPLFTFLPALLHLRSLAEHFGLTWDDELAQSRSVAAGPLQRFLFAPHQINNHLEHHLFPSVPWYHLPALQRALRTDPHYAASSSMADGYLWGRRTVLDDLATTAPEAAWNLHR